MSSPARNLSVVTSSPLGASEARVGRSPTGCAEGHATEGRSSRSEPVGRKSAKPTAKPASKTVAIRVVRTKASKRREEILAYCVGVGCVVGLALSGIDSTLALNAFVHVPMGRAAMLAIVIDALLVGAELSTLFSPCSKVKNTANLYICMAGFLSIFLNMAEFAQHGEDLAGKVLCGAVGASIPLLVLVSSRYAGYLYLSSK